MELDNNVINKMITLLLVTLFLSSNNLIAQQKIKEGLTFVGKKEYKGQEHYVSLDKFLGIDIDFMRLSEKCISAEGMFKFKVDYTNKVNITEVSGDLPNTLVKLISNKIILTKDLWEISDSYKKNKEYITFYYPVYLSLNLRNNCNKEDPFSYGWLYDFFDKKKIIKNGKGYIISPALYYGNR